MIRKTYPTSSVVQSEDLPAPGIIRAPLGTNPVNAPGNRETAPLELSATPRTKHPKLNQESWATSYAQSRSESKTARPKSRYNRSKRTRNEKRGRGYSR